VAEGLRWGKAILHYKTARECGIPFDPAEIGFEFHRRNRRPRAADPSGSRHPQRPLLRIQEKGYFQAPRQSRLNEITTPLTAASALPLRKNSADPASARTLPSGVATHRPTWKTRPCRGSGLSHLVLSKNAFEGKSQPQSRAPRWFVQRVALPFIAPVSEVLGSVAGHEIHGFGSAARSLQRG